MKKLIIQIPCYNEEQTLSTALADLPHQIDGIDIVEWLVIDDGSTDETVNVAKRNGVDHIVSHPQNLGLAKAFMTGLSTSLELGADIVVNTDADNQYRAECIPDLIQPILEGKADIVVGARPIDEIEHFSPTKKFLEKLGSWTVRRVSGTNIPDSPSGFRAISSSAARRLNVFNKYTYTLETIIQAGQKDIPITWVPIRTNREMRSSRLVKSIPSYIARSVVTIFRIFVVYKPFRFFMGLGSAIFLIGTAIGLRFLYYFFTESGEGHIQSLILSSILIGIGFQTVMVAFLADLLSVNRRLLEELQYKSRQFSNSHSKKEENLKSNGKKSRKLV
jgi:glycosyltransferase involved in cell wall biosynthesis